MDICLTPIKIETIRRHLSLLLKKLQLVKELQKSLLENQQLLLRSRKKMVLKTNLGHINSKKGMMIKASNGIMVMRHKDQEVEEVNTEVKIVVITTKKVGEEAVEETEISFKEVDAVVVTENIEEDAVVVTENTEAA